LSSSENCNSGTAPNGPLLVCKSPDSRKITVGHPSILALSGGRILVSFDFRGPGLAKLKGKKGKSERSGHLVQGQVTVSADKGASWTQKLEYPSACGKLFANGNNIYLLGYTNGLQIMRSGDGGENWSKPENITSQTGDRNFYEGGLPSILMCDDEIRCIALALSDSNSRGDICDLLKPVLLRAKCGLNLLGHKNWKIYPPGPKFSEFLDMRQASALGAPLFSVAANQRERNIGGGRWAGHPGWSNAHLLQIPDTHHPWQNSGKTAMHLLMRASLHRSNCAVLIRIEPDENGNACFLNQTTPCGSHFSLLPMPGGHLPFDILYDDKSRLFWLVSNAADNSLIAPRELPPAHAGLPSEQRTKLQLHFSRNLVDWQFAAQVANAEKHNLISIHEPAITVSGEDLYIAARASDSDAKNERDSNNIVFTTIPDFRSLTNNF